MPKVSTTITDNVKHLIDEMAEKEGKSFSRMCSDLIDRGMTQSHFFKLKEIGLKNNTYLVQILNVVGEMFFKMNGAESGQFESSKSPKEILNKISKWAKDLTERNFES